MKSIITLLLIMTIIACGTSQETVRKKEFSEKKITKENIKLIQDKKKKASEYFINGSMADMKGDYASAVLEYQSALELDPDAGIHFALGKDYLFLNKKILSLKHAKAAVKLEPKNIEYKHLLAQVFRMANLRDSSATIYRDILELDSTNTAAMYALGSLIENDKPLESLNIFNKLLKYSGPDWKVLVKIASINERLGNIEKTISTIEKLLKEYPNNLNLKKILIESYHKEGKYDKALELTEESIKIFPDDLQLIEYKAKILLSKNDWINSAKNFEPLIKSDKINLSGKIQIGRTFLMQSTKDSTLLPIAKKMFEEINADTNYWEVKFYLAAINVQQKNVEDGIKYYNEASKLAGWNPEIWIRLGGLLFDNERYDEAIVELNSALEHFPDDYYINFIIGLSYTQLKKYKKALPFLEKATILQKDKVDAFTAYGFALDKTGAQDKAIEILNKALTIEPNNIQALSNLGLIYDARKDWQKCDEIYEKALAVDSNNVLILNNYAYSLSERGIQLSRALKMSLKAVKAEPENSSYLDTLGWIYFMMGKYDEAQKWISKSLEIEESYDVLDHQAEIYLKLGKKEEALKAWEMALKKNPNNKEIKEKIEKAK